MMWLLLRVGGKRGERKTVVVKKGFVVLYRLRLVLSGTLGACEIGRGEGAMSFVSGVRWQRFEYHLTSIQREQAATKLREA